VTFLSDDITELRDHINAMSKRMIGDRILQLPQERALLDLYKTARTREEFSSRIQSMAGMVVAINEAAIARQLGKDLPEERGSLNLLRHWLQVTVSGPDIDEVCGVLKRINDLRKGYPAHGDNADTVLEAHDFFGVRYPIEDFGAAWERILRRYFEAMKKMSRMLADARDSEVD